MCETRVLGVLGGIGVLGPVLAVSSTSPKPTEHATWERPRKITSSSSIISYYINISIYLYRGGAIIGGIWGIRGFGGYRPFIGFPP
jgi:hypothetical protein